MYSLFPNLILIIMTNRFSPPPRTLKSTLLLLTIFSLWGCAKDSHYAAEEAQAPQEIATRTTETCRCYMQVRSVTNPPNEEVLWYFWDSEGGIGNEDFLIQGKGNSWIPPGSTAANAMPFPTPWIRLVEPSAGVEKEFHIGSFPLGFLLPADFTVNARVECRTVNPDGSENPVGTLYPNVPFMYGDGMPVLGKVQVVFFRKTFNCEDITGPNNQ